MINKVILKHVSGEEKIGYVVGIFGKIARVAWQPEGGDGVDIDVATERSVVLGWDEKTMTFGNWAVVA